MRKRDEALRGALLDVARTMAAAEGPEAINIRALAAKAGVSVGTVYNYFAGKDDILLALTEEYWQATLRDMRAAIHADAFVDQVGEIYAFLRARLHDSAGTLMNSLHQVGQAGRERMLAMQAVLRAALMERLAADARVPPQIWTECFTQAQFADFVILNLISLLRTGALEIDFFLQILERTLYGGNKNDAGSV